MSMKRPRDLDTDFVHHSERPTKRRKRMVPSTLTTATPPTNQSKSETSSANFPISRINKDELKARIRYHLKRCNKLRIQQGQSSSSSSHASSQSACIDSARNQSHDGPAITLGELEDMCERAMKEKEQQVKMEYENALSCRLVEQYESFMKFNSDMMTRMPWGEVASYVS